jgi:hypothetical protein
VNEILSYDVSQDAVKENKYLNIEQIAGIHGIEVLCRPFFLSIESGVMLERQGASMSKQLRPVRDCVIIPSFPVLPRLRPSFGGTCPVRSGGGDPRAGSFIW